MPEPITAYPQTRGTGRGPVLVLRAELSFWGGVDRSGTVIEAHHPDRGVAVAGTVLVLPGSKGSSSSSSVLAELIRAGTGPVAIVLARPDPIIALGALVADELYGIAVPVVTVLPARLPAIAALGTATVRSDPGIGRADVLAVPP